MVCSGRAMQTSTGADVSRSLSKPRPRLLAVVDVACLTRGKDSLLWSRYSAIGSLTSPVSSTMPFSSRVLRHSVCFLHAYALVHQVFAEHCSMDLQSALLSPITPSIGDHCGRCGDHCLSKDLLGRIQTSRGGGTERQKDIVRTGLCHRSPRREGSEEPTTVALRPELDKSVQALTSANCPWSYGTVCAPAAQWGSDRQSVRDD